MVVAALSSDRLLVGLGMELLGLRSVTPTETRLFLVGAVELSWCRMGVSGVDMRVPSGVTALLTSDIRTTTTQLAKKEKSVEINRRHLLDNTQIVFFFGSCRLTLHVVKLPYCHIALPRLCTRVGARQVSVGVTHPVSEER